MLNIQKYISCFETIEEANTYLSSNFKIDCKEDTVLSEADRTWYSVYVYSPRMHADLTDPIVQEANCLILDEDGSLVAKAANIAHEVASPEGLPQSFILENARVLERGEGIPIVIFNVEGEWFVGSRFSADAREKPLNPTGSLSYGFRVKDYLEFKKGSEWDTRFMNVDPRLCFSFLYVPLGSEGRVIPSKHEELMLLDVINLENGEELPQYRVDSMANNLSFMRPHYRSINGTNSLRHILKTMPWFRVGITLIDRNGLRVEIENPLYRVLKNAQAAGGRIEPIHVVKIFQACRDETDALQILQMFPKYHDIMKIAQETVDELWGELFTLWNSAKIIAKNKKSFAKFVDHHYLKHLLFMYREGKITSMRQGVLDLPPYKIVINMQRKHDKDLSIARRCLKIDNGGGDVRIEKDRSQTLSSEGL